MRLLAALRELLGVAALASLLLLLASGLSLMAAYVPSQNEAFASVLYLRRQAGVLALLRDVHAHVATIVVASGGLYLLVTWLAGAPPRERRAWWASAAAFLLVLFACFTGFLLPMDQDAYWGSVVRLGIVETVPVVGGPLADLLRGGPGWNASTLTRFYALHAGLVPWLLLAPLSLLGWELARSGTPETTRRGLSLALVVVAAVYVFAAAVPARLEPEASPGDAEYVPRPEWYFLWLFQLGKYVEGLPWLRSMLVPAAILAALLAAPLRTTSLQVRGAVCGLAVLGFLG